MISFIFAGSCNRGWCAQRAAHGGRFLQQDSWLRDHPRPAGPHNAVAGSPPVLGKGKTYNQAYCAIDLISLPKPNLNSFPKSKWQNYLLLLPISLFMSFFGLFSPFSIFVFIYPFFLTKLPQMEILGRGDPHSMS